MAESREWTAGVAVVTCAASRWSGRPGLGPLAFAAEQLCPRPQKPRLIYPQSPPNRFPCGREGVGS